MDSHTSTHLRNDNHAPGLPRAHIAQAQRGEVYAIERDATLREWLLCHAEEGRHQLRKEAGKKSAHYNA